MNLKPQMLVGDCHRCIGRAKKRFRTDGIGFVDQLRPLDGRLILEVRDVVELNDEVVEFLEREFGLTLLKEVCGNGKSGRASRRKVAN